MPVWDASPSSLPLDPQLDTKEDIRAKEEMYDTMPYEMLFNVRSKANTSQLNRPLVTGGIFYVRDS